MASSGHPASASNSGATRLDAIANQDDLFGLETPNFDQTQGSAGGNESNAANQAPGAKDDSNHRSIKERVKKLPDNLQWMESTAGAYISDQSEPCNQFTQIHKRYDGYDRPRIPQNPNGKSGNRIIGTPKHVFAAVRTVDDQVAVFGYIDNLDKGKESLENPKGKAARVETEDTAMEDVEDGEVYESSNSRAATTGRKDKFLKSFFFPDSQHPSLGLEFRRPSGQFVRYSVFTSHLDGQPNDWQRGDSGLGLDFYVQSFDEAQAAKIDAMLPEHEDLQRLFKEGKLMETRIRLSLDTTDYPLYSGLKRSEIPGFFKDPEEPKNDGDSLLCWLGSAASISIYSLWRPDWKSSNPQLQRFNEYFLSCTWLCRYHGFWWYYRLEYQRIMREEEPDTHVDILHCLPDVEVMLDHIEPPRWLVKEWETTKNSAGAVLNIKATQWAEFVYLKQYPDSETKAFALALSLRRERKCEKEIIGNLMTSLKSKGVSAVVFRSPKDLDLYIFSVSVDLYSEDDLKSFPVPQHDTRVRVTYSLGGGKVLRFDGKVIEDHWRVGGMFVIGATGPLNLEFGAEYIPIKLKFHDDPTSTFRQMNAIKALSQGQKRGTGVDFPAMMLGAPPVIERDGALASRLRRPQVFIWKSTLAHWNLNEFQKKAALDPLDKKTDETIIFGAAGTGKTSTTMAVANAAVRVKEKVIVCGPSHKSVDEAMAKLIKNKLGDIKMVRFKGTCYSAGKKKAGKGKGKERAAGPTEPEMDQTGLARTEQDKEKSDQDADEEFPVDTPAEATQKVLAIWRLISDSLADSHDEHKDYAYHILKQQDVEMRAKSNPEKESKAKQATRYLELQAQMAEPNWNRGMEEEIVSALIDEFNELNDAMDKAFLATVDVVFATCSATSHQALVDHFHGKIMIVEEGGQGNIADISTAVASHMDKVTTLIVNGDQTQCRPSISSEGVNEGGGQLGVSFFLSFREDTLCRYNFHELRIQYRMHPDLSRLVAPIFYPDTKEKSGTFVLDAQEVAQPTDVDAIWEAYHQPLGVAYRNNSHVVAIDTSDSPSSKFEQTTSSCNEGEAMLVCKYVEQLLAQPHPEKPDTRLQPNQIAVVTPYGGQRNLLKTVFANQGMFDLFIGGLEILTTTETQGGEYDIVLLSLVSNVSVEQDPRGPMALGWIYKEGLLCVGFTRARRALAIFGNFKGWVKTINSPMSYPHEVMRFNNRRKFRAVVEYLFIQGLIISKRDYNLVDLGEVIEEASFVLELRAAGQFPPMEAAQDAYRHRNPQAQGRGRSRGRGGARGGSARTFRSRYSYT